MPRRSRRWSGVVALGSAAMVLLLSGCDNFFTKGSGSSSGGTTIGGAGANYAYVLNGVTQTVSGFLIGAGTLTATPNSPYSFGFVPQAEVVTRANNFLYVAGPGALYSFAINSDGSLAGTTQATGVAIANELALAVSPDGQWLFGLNSISSTLDVWQINATTGVLTAEPGATYTITDAVASPSMLRVSPAGDYIFAAVGSAGDLVFTLDTTTGAVSLSQRLSLASAQTSDNSLVTDSTGSTLYIARSGVNGGLAVYTIGASGLLTAVTGSPFATGLGTFDVAVDATDSYVYAANRSDGTISGFSIVKSGALTPLSGSPYSSGSTVSSLVADRSGTYVLAAAAGGVPDLTLYSFDATIAGKLDTATTAVSGTDPAGSRLIALTH